MKTSFRLVALALYCGLCACGSPYADQIKQLDRAYAAGQIPAKNYFPARQQLVMADAQWRQQANAQIQAAAAGVAAQANAQTQQIQAEERARNDAIIQQGIRDAHDYQPVLPPPYFQRDQGSW